MPAPSGRSPNADTLTAAQAAEVARLSARACDGLLTAEETTQLRAILKDSSAARDAYLDCIALEQSLAANAGTRRVGEIERLREYIAGESISPSGRVVAAHDAPSADPPRSLRRTRTRIAWAAAAIAASLTLWFGIDSWVLPAPDYKGPDTTQSPPRVAFATTEDGPNSLRPEQLVPFGAPIPIGDGHVELVYACGSRLMLMGPAEFVPKPSGGVLRRGGLLASITEAGHGFTIETPNGKVVDLGTEFAVAVDDFGVSEVGVLDGKVEAFPTSLAADNPSKFELTEGKGLQWSSASILPLEGNFARFASATLRGLRNAEQTRLQADFTSGVPMGEAWRTTGPARMTPQGLELGGPDKGGPRPYLITNTELDPREGPITVVCEIVMAGDAAPTVSVLTRAENEIGVADAPCDQMLASCTYSTFSAQQLVLETGVKHEADREVVSHTRGALSVPPPQHVYQLTLRDDGMTVELTVRAKGRTESRTVTARSLFRGRGNFVAIEGPREGTAVVRRIEVTQDSLSPGAKSYRDITSLVGGGRPNRATARVMESLIPRESTQVLSEGFSAPQLDPKRWTTLEDVFVGEGSVSLGRDNPDQHIDTWRPRPYLFLTDRLDPAGGAVTILGTIEFSENFLAGYGASFAVVSRATPSYGQGAGWEQSIVRKGVRANFWPASVDLDHTLEIHARPNASSVSLLASRGARIDPASRTYVFRVVDDSENVTLTIVDPRHPDDSMQLSSPASSSHGPGLIGFESCWGSPVRIDDVRVYQATP